MKMRTRLLLTALVLLSAGFYLLVDWIVQDVRLHYFITMEESLVDTSVLLAEQVGRQVVDGRIEMDDSFRDALESAGERELAAGIYNHTKTNMNVRVLVVNRDEQIVYDSHHDMMAGDEYHWRDTRLALKGEYGARASYDVPGDMDSFHFYIAAPIVVDGEIVGAVTVGKPVKSIAPFMQQAKARLVISCTVAFLAILLMLIPVSLWIIHPVKALTGYARAIRDGRSVRRPKLGHGGEMSELATAFEEMRDALEGKQYVEEYVQSLTHEMKSPLAAIRGAAELLNEEMAPEQRKRFLDNIRSESERMQGLVDRMLSLAALEKRKGLMHTELIDAHELLNDVLDSLMPVARARKIEINKSVPDDLTLCGEYFLLRQALSNLLRNALDFSPDGAAVELVVRRENERMIFEVLDRGSGIPDYAIDRIFERFYSLQRPANGKKGSGLGLNFVREIAKLHSGDVRLSNRPEGGVCASLLIPVEG
ncbi:MAG: two-component system sensor histidine kinase CreC [Pontiellaceae bacterium]|nr:two-component system sensor histidine kinase CreC [Pontiellaceae bacterium]MBN2784655.1 two-component system sensor histidine kinase CreC [Pontiellaceae bacterium]